MPAKKKKGKKGKKKGKKGPKADPADPDFAIQEKYDQAVLRIESLERALVSKSAEASRVVGEMRTFQSQLLRYRDDIDREKADRFDITVDMTRQYKAMQTELFGRIKGLEDEKRGLAEEMEARDHRFQEELRARDGTIAEQREEITQLKQRIEDLSNEFSAILKETLNSISDRIGERTGGAE